MLGSVPHSGGVKAPQFALPTLEWLLLSQLSPPTTILAVLEADYFTPLFAAAASAASRSGRTDWCAGWLSGA